MRRRLALGLAAGLVTAVLSLGACAHPNPGPAADAASPSAQPSAQQTAETKVDKLLVFVVENHSQDQMQKEMPYINSLATKYGYADNFFAIRHPSLPNYLAMTGGSTFGVDTNDPPATNSVSSPSVFGTAVAAGKTAKLYAEAMTSNCQATPEGRYAVKHNPWPYFAAERALCQENDVPLTELAADVDAGQLPAVGMVIPDLCNDAHDCTLARADDWMKKYVGEVLAGPDWESGRLAVVITADEDDKHHDNLILTVVAHPALEHVVVNTHLDHYSIARSYAGVAGVPPLEHAAKAPSLLAEFGLTEQ